MLHYILYGFDEWLPALSIHNYRRIYRALTRCVGYSKGVSHAIAVCLHFGCVACRRFDKFVTFDGNTARATGGAFSVMYGSRSEG